MSNFKVIIFRQFPLLLNEGLPQEVLIILVLTIRINSLPVMLQSALHYICLISLPTVAYFGCSARLETLLASSFLPSLYWFFEFFLIEVVIIIH